MNAQAITKAKATAKATKVVAPEKQEDISTVSLKFENEKRFIRLDEINARIYEGEDDSEWEDADLYDDEDDEDDEDEDEDYDYEGECEKMKELFAEVQKIVEQTNNTEIEVELARFEIMAAYFDTADALVEYATSNEDQFRSFFDTLKCKADLDRSLFFNDTYDDTYNVTRCDDAEYEYYRNINGMSDAAASVFQLEWDEVYESLGDEHYRGDIEKLNMKQLKFLCIEFNIPRDGKKHDIVERLKSPYELYVPKNKRTQPFDTFKTDDPNQEKYDKLMEEKSYYKNSKIMKTLRQRKIMGCQLMRMSKSHIKYIFNELDLELPNGKHGKQENLVKMLIEHYYELY
jgi:hypothetical protein